MASSTDESSASKQTSASDLSKEAAPLPWYIDPPKSKHITTPITRKNFKKGKLIHNGHSSEDIGNAIVDHLSRPADDLTKRQINALHDWKWFGYCNIGKPVNTRDLKRFFGIFNDLFFNGVLNERRIAIRSAARHLTSNDTAAWVSRKYKWRRFDQWLTRIDGKLKLELPTKVLEIVVCERHVVATMAEFPRNVIGFLLHEMLHAVFMWHSCTCDKGCKAIDLAERASTGRHAAPWQKAAAAIQNTFLGINGAMLINIGPVKLCGMTSVAHHLLVSGHNIPTKAEYFAWASGMEFDAEAFMKTYIHTNHILKFSANSKSMRLNQNNRCISGIFQTEKGPILGFGTPL